MTAPAPPARALALAGTAMLLLLGSCAGPPSPPGGTDGPTVHVLSSGGFAPAHKLLVPQFESATGARVSTAYGPSMGGASHSIPMRLERGEPADLVILAKSALGGLAERGHVLPDSRTDLADSSIGAAVRSGATKPDISSTEAFVAALAAAESIGYSGSLSGNYLSTDLFPRLGIWTRIESKCKRITDGPVGEAVARGEVELGFQQVSELLAVDGIDYAGPIPAELQKISTFSAGLTASGSDSEHARALLEFLSSAAAARTIAATGLVPKAAAPATESAVR